MYPHSFLKPPLNSLKHGWLNIYTSALACLMLTAYSHRRVNEWKSFRQNTSSGWWVPGHFTVPVPQVQPPFQGIGDRDPGFCSGAQLRSTALLTLLSLWKEAICAFRVGSAPKRLNRGGPGHHVRALQTKTTSHLISCKRTIHRQTRMRCTKWGFYIFFLKLTFPNVRYPVKP